MSNADEPMNIEALLPLYALGGLNAAEQAQVEQYLDQYPRARLEVETMADAAALLGEAAEPVDPPPQIKSAVMNHVRRSAAGARANRPRVIEPEKPARPSLATRLWGTLRRPLLALGAAAVAIALLFGGYQLLMIQRQLQTLQAENERLNASIISQRWMASYILDEETLQFAIAGTGLFNDANGQFLLRPNQTQGMLLVSDLEPLSAEQTYQFWVIDEETGLAVSAGTFDIGDDNLGVLRVDLETPVSEFESIGVTIEPAGGSDYPSENVVMMAGLP